MKSVLITGGSSGIGFGLSKKFAAEGYELLWIALSESEIESSKKELQADYPTCNIHSLTQDLSHSDACQKVYDWAKSIGEVDVVINNAGFGNHGYFNQIPLEKELAVIDVNLKALFLLTRYFLDDMISRNKGTIINISSNSSFETVPRMLTYSSTKAFVKHFSRGLNEELKMQGSDVKVITICPAAISDTNFRKVNDMDSVKTFDGLATTTTKEVVNDTWRAFQNGKSFQISGWKMRWLYKLYGFMPFGLIMFLTKRETEN